MRTPALVAISMCILAYFAPGTAYAQPREEDDAVRTRFAVGGYAGATGVPDWHGGGGIGAHGRAGVQFSELVGADVELSGATLLLTGSGRFALTVDFTPNDHISVGTGASLSGFYTASIGAGSDYSGSIVGAPLRIAIHPGRVRHDDDRRRGFEILVEADLGLVWRTNRGSHQGDPGGGLHAGLGYAWF